MLFLPCLQESTPMRIVFAETEDDTRGAQGILPTLLDIWIRTLVKMEANPFLAKVVVSVT